MYLDPALFQGLDISPEEFSSPTLARLFTLLREKAAEHASLSPATLSAAFSPEEESHITHILQKPEVLANGKKALADYINIIRTENQTGDDTDLRAYALRRRNHQGHGG